MRRYSYVTCVGAFLRVCLLGAALAWTPDDAEAQSNREVRASRLLALARLDGTVRYFHPVVSTSRTAWDSLFAAHVVQAVDAPTSSLYRAQVAAMLAGLGDSLTRVLSSAPASLRIGREAGTPVGRPRTAGPSLTLAALRQDSTLVLDLRGGAAVDTTLLKALGAVAPLEFTVQHAGLMPTTLANVAGYSATWRATSRAVERPSAPSSAWTPHVVIVGDAHTILPTAVLGLRASGRLSLLTVGTPSLAVGGSTYRIDLGEGLRVLVRMGKTSRYGIAVSADTVLPDSARAFALASRHEIRSLTASRVTSDSARAHAAGLPPINVVRALGGDQSMQPFPSRGYRILAAARVWNTFDIFSPYKSRFTSPWSSVLTSKMPAVERASDALAFSLAIAALVKETNDGHSTTHSDALTTQFFPLVTTPFQMRFIEGKAIVVRLAGPLRDTTSLKVGDEVISIDGRSVDSISARYAPYLATSTPQGLQYNLQWRIPAGPANSPASVVVQGADGLRREITVRRPAAYDPVSDAARGGPIIRMLPDGIGYVDLARLEQSMVDSMFNTLGTAKAIIFDMRGYPQNTGLRIAQRLNVKRTAVRFGRIERRLLTSPDSATATSDSSGGQFVQPSPMPTYTGRTVMLIDERAGSQSETTGMMFEATNGTQFIGTPTVGQNGNVTDWIVPGNIRIVMSGMSVTFADGRPLQGVGLTPHLLVAPTIRGVRSGVDEVLTAAFRNVGGRGDIRIVEDRYASPSLARGVPEEPMAAGWLSPFNADARVGVDTTLVGPDESAPRGSAHITVPGKRTAVTLFQFIQAREYRGKRVRLSGWFKTRGVPDDGAGLWFRIDGRGIALFHDNMAGRRVRGTEWTKISVVADVPVDANGILAGTMFVGTGEAWLDDLVLEIVDGSVPVTGQGDGSSNGTADQVRDQIARYANAPTALVNGRFLELTRR